MEELKRVSSRVLPGMMLNDFEDEEHPQQSNQIQAPAAGAGMETEASVTFTGAVEDHKRTRSAATGHTQDANSGGAGHTGETGAGGAGALPVSDGTINIANGNHFRDDDPSMMSYIYGDEDSQHMALPDYSMSHMTPKLIPAMTPIMAPSAPAMTTLAEDHDDDSEMGTDEDFDDIDPKERDDGGMAMAQIMGASGRANPKGNKPKSGGYTIKVLPPQPTMESVASMSPAGSLDDNASNERAFMQ